MKKSLKLQRSESFYIRDGWIEKVFLAYKNNQIGTFSPKKGIKILGVGFNMVKSLRYWVEACRLVDSFGKDTFTLSDRGRLLYENDPYMESIFSWGLLHYWLVTNEEFAPVFYSIFNSRAIKLIKRKETSEYLAERFFQAGFEDPNVASIQKDVATLVSSYVYDEADEDRTPEENISCPFSSLRLMKKTGKDNYEKTPIPITCIDYRLLFICLRERYTDGSFNIDDSFDDEQSPVLCFNMDRSDFLTLLGEMKNNGLIELNRTAGLNVDYISSKRSDEALLKEYLEEKELQSK